jgi:hypothetical protein
MGKKKTPTSGIFEALILGPSVLNSGNGVVGKYCRRHTEGGIKISRFFFGKNIASRHQIYQIPVFFWKDIAFPTRHLSAAENTLNCAAKALHGHTPFARHGSNVVFILSSPGKD